MKDNDLARTDLDAPPARLTPPQQALWWLKKGGMAMGPEWHRAHQICQAKEGDRAHDLVHGLAHMIEGDKANAAYWYRRAQHIPAPDIEAEWQRLATVLSA